MTPALDELTDEERGIFAEQGTPVGETEAVVQPEGDADPVIVPAATPSAVQLSTALSATAPVAEISSSLTGISTSTVEVSSSLSNAMVPHAALHAERMRANGYAQQLATLTARTNAMLLETQRKAAQPQPGPTLEEDPATFILNMNRQFEEMQAASQQDAVTRQVDGLIVQDEQLFQSSQPDYNDAQLYYIQSRSRELAALGFPPEQAKETLFQEVRTLAQQSWQRNASFAQSVYQLAEARGYRPGAPQQLTPVPVAQSGSTAAPTAVIAAVNAGQAASKSMSGTGGAGGGVATAEDLLNMTDAQFAAYLKLGQKGADERFEGAMGG